MQKALVFFALAALLCVAYTSAAAVEGFIDAGSSGSKVFRVVGDAAPESKKYGPAASTLTDKATGLTVTFGTESIKVIAGGNVNFRADYMKAMLGKSFEDTDTAADVIPLQATAGMRIVPRAANKLVYEGSVGEPGICGAKRTTDNVAVAPAGEKCGTVAGTVEAFYEWLAVFKDVVNKGKVDVSTYNFKFGIISSGGASAQLAWPMTKEETTKFKTFRTELAGTLPEYDYKTSEFPPFFNAINAKSRRWLDKKNWLNDFVSYVPYRELPKTHRDNFKKAGFYALAVVSFLSIGPDSRTQAGVTLPDNLFLAGGVDKVTLHLQKNTFCQVAHGDYDYGKCRNALTKLFKKDIMYTKVAKWFGANHDATIPFYANTNAAGFTQSLKNDFRPAGDKFVAGVNPATIHSTIDSIVTGKVDTTVDALNPDACKAAVDAGDAKKCYDGLSKWLAMRCTHATLKTKQFNMPVDRLLSDCGSAFFIDTYYFSFFSTHTVEWPTTGAETNEFRKDDAAGAPLAVKSDYDKSAAPAEDGLTDPTYFKTVDWTMGAMFYYKDPGAPFTHLLREKGSSKDLKIRKDGEHMEATEEEVAKAKTDKDKKDKKGKGTTFIEESNRFKLHNILVNNKA